MSNNFIPVLKENFTPFGAFDFISAVIKSENFYPVYISGESGNGKTESALQACAQNNRECFRINITQQTDEIDLLGGWTLIDGKTVWNYGPVIHAMSRGAILLLDEVNFLTPKGLCLIPVMEGNKIFVKQKNRYVSPKRGFNIIATANTKGRGDDSGKYIGSNYLNEAFLDRFCVTIEQEYPSEEVEKKILQDLVKEIGISIDGKFVDALVEWAANIRRTSKKGVHDEIITTRRLLHIVKTYAITKNYKKTMMLCLSRYDEIVRVAFEELFLNYYNFNE